MVDPVTNPASSAQRKTTLRAISSRTSKPTNRDPGDNLLQHISKHSGDHIGIDITWCDGINRNVEPGAFLRQRLREPVNPRFGGSIIDLTILPGLTIDQPILTILPNLRSRIPSITLRHILKQPPRLVSMTSCHILWSILWTVPSRVMPALLTRIPTGPRSASICLTPAAQASKSETSHL